MFPDFFISMKKIRQSIALLHGSVYELSVSIRENMPSKMHSELKKVLSKHRGLIFDMDGVMIDSERFWVNIEPVFLQQIAPGWTKNDQDSITGLSMRDVYKVLQEKHQVTLGWDDFLATYRDLPLEIYQEKCQLIPGVLRQLEGANSLGHPTALCSSSPRQFIEIVLKRFALHSKFNSVVSSDDTEGIGKPDPAVYLLSAQRLALNPKDCVAIEDSDNGVASAKAAGMFCLGFRNTWNHKQSLAKADLLIEGWGD